VTAGERQISAYSEGDACEADGMPRRWPEAVERELVAATFEPGASVSIVARRHDLNTNPLFKRWRQFGGCRRGAAAEPARLPPVGIAGTPTGPGETVLGGAAGAGAAMILVPHGVRVWLATGRTDMRRGMNGLALQVQETLRRDPHGGCTKSRGSIPAHSARAQHLRTRGPTCVA
jgi:hypothetical protein